MTDQQRVVQVNFGQLRTAADVINQHAASLDEAKQDLKVSLGPLSVWHDSGDVSAQAFFDEAQTLEQAISSLTNTVRQWAKAVRDGVEHQEALQRQNVQLFQNT